MAHRLDPGRREVYVEGARDRRFLQLIGGAEKSRHAEIFAIEFVDVAGGDGGNRVRLLRFAEAVATSGAQIRAFVDRDRPAPNAPPPNVILTDTRDLEGYVLTPACFAKLSVAFPRISMGEARSLLGGALREARRVAALRDVSATKGLDLPFQRTRLATALEFAGDEVTLDLARLVGTLLQNAALSLTMRQGVLEGVETTLAELMEVPDHLLVHGKDAFEIAQGMLRRRGIHLDDEVLWMGFDNACIDEHPNLREVVAFLRQA